jgi:hypothetical protein
MDDLFESLLVNKLNARQKNIVRSPKQGGAGDRDSLPYLEHLGIDIKDKTQPIQFTPIDKIVKARERRSGQIRSYKLRETIITLVKR